MADPPIEAIAGPLQDAPAMVDMVADGEDYLKLFKLFRSHKNDNYAQKFS